MKVTRMKHFADGHTEELIEERAETPQRGDPQEGDLCTAVRRYLGYIADVRSGAVKRLDRDVVMNYAEEMARHLSVTLRVLKVWFDGHGRERTTILHEKEKEVEMTVPAAGRRAPSEAAIEAARKFIVSAIGNLAEQRWETVELELGAALASLTGVGAGAPGALPETDYEERFARLRGLRQNWDSYGARTIAEAAIVTVRHLLDDAAIVPTSKGGVQIEWHRHGADIEIEVAPSGDVESVFWAQGDVADGERGAGGGLTVARLTALLRETIILCAPADVERVDFEVSAKRLLPRLGVSRGAPTPAMIEPTVAMIDAALAVADALSSDGVPRDDVVQVLRAALAAQEQP